MVYAKPESFRDNKNHKIVWDFEIHADHLILTEVRESERERERERENFSSCGFCCSGRPHSEKKAKRLTNISTLLGAAEIEDEGNR